MRIRDMLYVIWKKVTQGVDWENIEPSSSKLTAGMVRAWADPVKGVAKVDGFFRATSDITSSDVLFVLPEEYRPYMDTNIPAILTISASTAHAYTIRVKPNGEIVQYFGTSIREGMFSGTLPLRP